MNNKDRELLLAIANVVLELAYSSPERPSQDLRNVRQALGALLSEQGEW